MSAASLDSYTSKITDSVPNTHGSLELKKMTFERGVKSKVLVVHALEEFADKLNKEIINR